MSGTFLSLVQRSHRLANLPPPTPAEHGRFEMGRMCALQFIDAARAGGVKPDYLFSAMLIVGKPEPAQLRGFLTELQDFIEESAR